MKDYLIDICLVGLLIFMLNSFMNHFHIETELFNQEIVSFEESLQNDEVIESDYGINYQVEDNHISLFIKAISDICISIIRTIVLIISNFISTLLS